MARITQNERLNRSLQTQATDKINKTTEQNESDCNCEGDCNLSTPCEQAI